MKQSCLLKKLVLICITIFGCTTEAVSQRFDSTIYSVASSRHLILPCYNSQKRIDCYQKPRSFSFVTQVPKVLSISFKNTFSKKSLPALSAITVSTLVLIAFDHKITNSTQNFSNNIGIRSDILYRNVIGFKLGSKYIPVYQAPQNFNTAIYSLGEGFTSVVLTGAMFVYGKVKDDNRALQTASQIMQSQFAVGIFSQLGKRIAGRESPRVKTGAGGVWRPLVSFSDFQKHTSRYDAFPSGHLASMMATVTVLISNYPEKKWLKPLGYGLIGLVGYGMINNGVHWAGDYPLALGIGYLCGKASVNLNRFVGSGAKPKKRSY
jgi:hypothetical protein